MPVCPAAAPLQELEEAGGRISACQTPDKQQLQEHGNNTITVDKIPEHTEDCQQTPGQPQQHSNKSPPTAGEGYSADGEGEPSAHQAPGWHRDKKIRAAKRAARSELSVSRGDWWVQMSYCCKPWG
jgi:hypothetical protein